MARLKCFGDYERPISGARKCIDCCDRPGCMEETALLSHDAPRPEKKPLDPKWAKELIDHMLGPNMAVLSMKLPKGQKNLEGIITKAIVALYAENDYATTNEWVVAASNRAWSLYNTFVTAKLMDYFDNGLPEPSKIIVAKSGSGIH